MLWYLKVCGENVSRRLRFSFAFWYWEIPMPGWQLCCWYACWETISPIERICVFVYFIERLWLAWTYLILTENGTYVHLFKRSLVPFFMVGTEYCNAWCRWKSNRRAASFSEREENLIPQPPSQHKPILPHAAPEKTFHATFSFNWFSKNIISELSNSKPK